MITALVPGSYDPITLGHLDIITRVSSLFDRVIVLVSPNSAKNYMFDEQTSAELAKDAVKNLKNVSVDIYGGLLADYSHNNKVDVIVKGIRNSADYEYENNMALSNTRLYDDIYSGQLETLFMPCSPHYSYISSTLARVMIKRGCNLSEIIPNENLLKSFL